MGRGEPRLPEWRVVAARVGGQAGVLNGKGSNQCVCCHEPHFLYCCVSHPSLQSQETMLSASCAYLLMQQYAQHPTLAVPAWLSHTPPFHCRCHCCNFALVDSYVRSLVPMPPPPCRPTSAQGVASKLLSVMLSCWGCWTQSSHPSSTNGGSALRQEWHVRSWVVVILSQRHTDTQGAPAVFPAP
jgi:hypothetical protein